MDPEILILCMFCTVCVFLHNIVTCLGKKAFYWDLPLTTWWQEILPMCSMLASREALWMKVAGKSVVT